MCNVGDTVARNGVEFDRFHCIGAGNTLHVWHCWMFADALAEASNFIGVGGVPSIFVFGVTAELAVFQYYTSFMVEDWASHGCRFDIIVNVIILQQCKTVVRGRRCGGDAG